jgi:hypothetical protein
MIIYRKGCDNNNLIFKSTKKVAIIFECTRKVVIIFKCTEKMVVIFQATEKVAIILLIHSKIMRTFGLTYNERILLLRLVRRCQALP